jgi:ParB-like chromosome segregation protein Spo0J
MPKPKPTTASTIPIHCSYARLADVTSLVANPRNPNKHSDKQVALLAKVIRHQGWRAPITVSKRSGFIVTGHGRLAAALLLQVEQVPIDEQDFATEADEWAHLVADNRIAELADADRGMIADLIKELDELQEGNFDTELLGFTEDEMGAFDIEESEMPELPSGEKEPFQQMTFTVHDEQSENVKAAIAKAKSMGHGESTVNENSNGNALAFVCQSFNRANT